MSAERSSGGVQDASEEPGDLLLQPAERLLQGSAVEQQLAERPAVGIEEKEGGWGRAERRAERLRAGDGALGESAGSFDPAEALLAVIRLVVEEALSCGRGCLGRPMELPASVGEPFGGNPPQRLPETLFVRH